MPEMLLLLLAYYSRCSLVSWTCPIRTVGCRRPFGRVSGLASTVCIHIRRIRFDFFAVRFHFLCTEAVLDLDLYMSSFLDVACYRHVTSDSGVDVERISRATRFEISEKCGHNFIYLFIFRRRRIDSSTNESKNSSPIVDGSGKGNRREIFNKESR